jgi:magnesium chelatase family protein
VLFLDELPEFSRNSLEVLRVPLEEGSITIGRATQVLTFPCRFMLVASMNPCPCGFLGSEKECKCTETSIKRYIGKVSGPLLDRIDIQVEVNSVKYANLVSNKAEETSEIIRARVNKARQIQFERYKNLNINSNAELTPKLIEEYCKLNSEGRKILQTSYIKLGMSARAYNRILKVARTIADLDESENIETKHLLEAIQYRSLDKKINKMKG